MTVMFVDIRGFTRRSAGEPPQRVVDLLNRFFTLSVTAIEKHGGHVNKFLGDGLMALFGVPRRCDDQADRALAAARTLLAELGRLNDELGREDLAPLAVGIGIHTGPALVGCVGATLDGQGGRKRIAQGVHRHRRDGQSGEARRAAHQELRRADPAQRCDAAAIARDRGADVPGAAGSRRVCGAADGVPLPGGSVAGSIDSRYNLPMTSLVRLGGPNP